MALFVKGQSGNPAGKPKGARNKLAEDFVKDLHEAWGAHGKAAIEQVVASDPSKFLDVVAKVIPKDFNISVEHSIADMGDDDLLRIASGRSLGTVEAPQGSSVAH